ncbi:hypothetical protein L3X38_041296 [Prunus dulcis]|uniref:Uncharacterized protein n=1 Tax=Prunus dulcis TaxID=3755 RepID=A0AAD4USY7_PRUDU|nr:hypothetical protein L3X38_041296 [Prunus dulcis]
MTSSVEITALNHLSYKPFTDEFDYYIHYIDGDPFTQRSIERMEKVAKTGNHMGVLIFGEDKALFSYAMHITCLITMKVIGAK